jgi:hypothetical protein
VKVRKLIDYLEKFPAGEEVRSVIQNAEGMGDMTVEPSQTPVLKNPNFEENIPYLEIQPNEELRVVIRTYFRDISRKINENKGFF